MEGREDVASSDRSLQGWSSAQNSRSLARDLNLVLTQRGLFLFALIRTDLRTKYRRSVIGIGWAFLMPLLLASLMAIVMAYLFSQPVGDYFLYVYSGFVAWELITAAALGGGQSFIASGSFMRAFAVPPVAYIVRSVVVATVGFLIAGLGVLIVAIVAEGVSWSWISLPASLGAAMLLAFSVAVPMAFLVTRFRDSGQMLILLFQALWYVSPVFISTSYFESNSQLRSWNEINPVAQYLELFRAPILRGEIPSLRAYTVVLCAAAFLLAVGFFTYRRRSARIVLEL